MDNQMKNSPMKMKVQQRNENLIMLEVYQVQMELVDQETVETAGGLSEGDCNNVCEQSETKMEVTSAKTSQ